MLKFWRVLLLLALSKQTHVATILSQNARS